MTLARPLRGTAWIALSVLLFTVSCARTEIIESPRTGYVADTGEPKDPTVVWSSRTLGTDFDYLGLVKSSSWTYQGALDRLVDGGRELRADAIVDVHFERVGFLKTMQAFAIKYK
jgi:hypothetical protein